MELTSWLITGAMAALLLWIVSRVVPWVNDVIKSISAARKLPCKPRHWLWGNTHQLRTFEDMYTMAEDLTNQGHKVFVVWFTFFLPIICFCHPDTIKLILRTAEPKTSRFGGGYEIMKSWIGDGILVSSGPKWERNRKLLTPAFHFDILKPYVKIYNQAVEVFMEKVDSLQGRMEVYRHVSLMTLDIIMRCALSYDNDIQQRGDRHPYVEAVSTVSGMIFHRAVRPWLFRDGIFFRTTMGKEWKRLCDYMHTFSNEIIEKRKQTLKSDPDALAKRHLDFLDILLTARDEDGVGLPDKDIRDEVDTFMFAGHDTTASAISWSIYALARFRGELHKVYEDVYAAIGDKPQVDWDDIGKLKYVPLFIKEVMRYFSIVVQVSRQNTEPLVVEGVTIPPGAYINVTIKETNHNPHIWPDHKDFRPDRFATDSFIERDPYMFVPFSAGPRNCIGQNFALNEIKVAICRLVLRYHIALDRTYPDVEMIPVVVMRPKNGIHLIFTKRD